MRVLYIIFKHDYYLSYADKHGVTLYPSQMTERYSSVAISAIRPTLVLVLLTRKLTVISTVVLWLSICVHITTYYTEVGL